jgi:hypothetical protein
MILIHRRRQILPHILNPRHFACSTSNRKRPEL